MPTIGEKIKSLRQELGMSADDLAAKLGKNRATIYRYESDEIGNMPLSIITPLAEALQTTPAYLMGWDTEPVSKPAEPELSDTVRQIIDVLVALPADRQQEALRYLRYLSGQADN